MILEKQNAANKACTRRVGFCAIYKRFSGFELFLLPSRVHAAPAPVNASRYNLSHEK